MPTLVSNVPKGQYASNRIAMNSNKDATWNTHTMTPTSNREEVSWSSSDGSTYYSDGKPSLVQQSSEESTEESTEYSDDEVSLQQRRQTRRPLRQKEHDKTVSHSADSFDAMDYNERSRDRKERAKDFRPRKGQRVIPVVNQKRKKTLRLQNVDSFSAIEIATGSEDVSAVGFLTTEDTAEVFCKAGIPFEVTANKKIYEKISAISSSSTCDSSAESSYSSATSSHSSDSASNDGSRIYQDRFVEHAATDTERATVRSQTSEVSTKESSVTGIDRHEVALVSASYQDPVSSIEGPSTLDDLSLGSSTSASSSFEEPRIQTPRRSPVQRRESVTPRRYQNQVRESVTPRGSPNQRREVATKEVMTSYQIDSKASRMKEIERKKSDLIKDEKIRQLKEKIRRISDLSNTNITIASSEVDSNLSPALQSQGIYVKKFVEQEDNVDDDNLNGDEQLIVTSRFEARATRQQSKPILPHNDYRRSFEADKSLVGTVIHPVEEKEEISILRFDTSARPLELDDIEAGHFRSSKSKSEKRRTSLTSINEHTKVLITGIQYRAIAAYDHVMPIIARKRAEFLRKPRYEQILIIAIGALFSLFLVLLFVMIGQ